MKCIIMPLTAAVVLSAVVSKAHAASNTWADGFPKTGTVAGTIQVKGKFTPDDGFTIMAQGTAASVWLVGSGRVLTYAALTIDTTTGDWSATLTGLTSGKQYNVVIQSNEKSGLVVNTIATDPKTATAK